MSVNKSIAVNKMRTKVLMLLSAGHLITDMAAGALPILLPIIQTSLNLSYSATGLISLIFNFSSSIIQPLLGFWSDKVKARWLLPAGCLLSMIGLSLAGVVSSYGLILAVVFLSGLGSAAYHPEGSKVSRLASGHRLTTGMSLFIVGGALGAALGSLIMAQLLDKFDRSASVYFIIPGIIMAILFFILNNKLPDEPSKVAKKQSRTKYSSTSASIGATNHTNLSDCSTFLDPGRFNIFYAFIFCKLSWRKPSLRQHLFSFIYGRWCGGHYYRWSFGRLFWSQKIFSGFYSNPHTTTIANKIHHWLLFNGGAIYYWYGYCLHHGHHRCNGTRTTAPQGWCRFGLNDWVCSWHGRLWGNYFGSHC